jgi:hypothetical protein
MKKFQIGRKKYRVLNRSDAFSLHDPLRQRAMR